MGAYLGLSESTFRGSVHNVGNHLHNKTKRVQHCQSKVGFYCIFPSRQIIVQHFQGEIKIDKINQANIL